MTSPTHRAGADVPVAYARVHDAAHPSYYDVVLPDSQEVEMWAYDLLPLYSGATVAALQARIAELEARNAASERDAGRYRFLLRRVSYAQKMSGNHHWYLSTVGVPLVGPTFDGAIDAAIDAHAQGQAGEGKDG